MQNQDLPPLIFAGMRYIIASSLLLLYVFFKPKYRKELFSLSKKWWLKLIFYGLIFYTITQGAQFFGLLYLEAITVSLLLSFTPILVLLFASIVLKEKANWIQIIFVLLAIGGALLYFLFNPELTTAQIQVIGLIIVIVGVLANAFSTIIGRSINQSKEVSTIVITSVSMFIGSIILLVTGLVKGLITEDLPTFSLVSIGYILWLSVVNTAFAFTIWNFVMQKLEALEISIINNTMLFQITILAVIFLGERPTAVQWVGLAVVALVGMALPIIGNRKKRKNQTTQSEEKV